MSTTYTNRPCPKTLFGLGNVLPCHYCVCKRGNASGLYITKLNFEIYYILERPSFFQQKVQKQFISFCLDLGYKEERGRGSGELL